MKKIKPKFKNKPIPKAPDDPHLPKGYHLTHIHFYTPKGKRRRLPREVIGNLKQSRKAVWAYHKSK